MRVAVSGSVAMAVVLALTGCTDSPTEDGSTTSASAARVTQTVTHTATETITATVTATETITATVTSSPEIAPSVDEPSIPAPRPPTPARPTPTGPDAPRFDVDAAHWCAERILRDIATVDERLVHGIAVASGLRLLASSYGCLADRGAPPGVDPADYLPRLATLEDFALQAAENYPLDPLQGAATYDVVRQETTPVLQLLNRSTGSSYALP